MRWILFVNIKKYPDEQNNGKTAEWNECICCCASFPTNRLLFSPANCFLAIEEALIAHNGKDGDDHKGQTAFFYFGLKEELR